MPEYKELKEDRGGGRYRDVHRRDSPVTVTKWSDRRDRASIRLGMNDFERTGFRRRFQI